MNQIDKNIEIKIVNNWSENDIVDLYKAGGWWKETYNSSEINNLIKGSFAFVVVINNKLNKAIGMGRILSDGISVAFRFLSGDLRHPDRSHPPILRGFWRIAIL